MFKTVLSGLYFLLWRLRIFLYEHRVIAQKKVNCFVVSIGNLTMGGTGKTPTTLFLAQQYQSRGVRVGIVSRGYKGQYKESVVVVSDGITVLESPETVGDEPVLMAKRLNGVPIAVSRDRALGCQWLIDHFKVQVILLDDGFQHLRLHRDFNILLIDTTQTNYDLLPKGPMREPLAAASRADVILLTRWDDSSSPFHRPFAATIPVIQTSFSPLELIHIPSGGTRPVSTLFGEPIVAVCGIGNPNAFIKMLEQLGAKICQTVFFSDHFYYTAADIQKIESARKTLGATSLVTTEKDAIKIERFSSVSIDIWALRIQMTFLSPPEQWENLLFNAS